ncbi:iron-containing alcohol dehydrogenase [Pedococcus sp. P5_B7]
MNTIFGRGLLPELGKILNRPTAVVTMDDLRPLVEEQIGADGFPIIQAGLNREYLEETVASHQHLKSIVGVGGGQALDAAKYLAGRLNIPFFQVPTALSVNAAWGHRSAVRIDGVVQYVGWAKPEAIFVDFDIVRSAPALLNWSGAADVLCYHTALWDWRFAQESGNAEQRWPFDPDLAEKSREAMQRIVDNVDSIRDLTDEGIRALVDSLQYGGMAFANAGWNPRHIEGADHFVFYALEYVTGRSFLHGQAVGLGILIASALQGNDPDWIRGVIDRLGVPYRPADMGVTWDDVNRAFDAVPEVIKKSKLWYTVLSERELTPAFRNAVQSWIEAPAGTAWTPVND